MRHALALLLALLVSGPPASASAVPARDASVVHVDDGDTIEVWLDGRIERVRYIGIDAPEIAHDGVGAAPGGEAATRLNQSLVRGRRVRLEFDREKRDRYGRLLAYVWVGGTMVNLEMVRRGYARALTIPPNVRYEEWFARAEAEAQADRLGLWDGRGLDGAATAPHRREPPRSRDSRAFRPFVPRRARASVASLAPSASPRPMLVARARDIRRAWIPISPAPHTMALSRCGSATRSRLPCLNNIRTWGRHGP